MSEPDTSPGGSEIIRHEKRKKPFTLADQAACSIEEIERHIERHIGKVESVYHEILSDLVHIDVHIVRPTPGRNFTTLVTTGMSDLPMKAPEGFKEWRFAELMLCLPPEWPLSDEDMKSERNYWPVRALKFLARFPHEYDTWLSNGHTIPNGDPPQPLDDSVPFCCLLLAAPRTVPAEFSPLKISDEKTIHFFGLYPLHAGEVDYKLKHGTNKLEALFAAKGVTELVDPRRPAVTAAKWWKFW